MTADTDTRKLAEAATPDLAEQLIVHTMTCAVGPTDCPTCTILKEAADEITALRAKVKALQEALVDASERVADWGAYAGKYFQEKHDLEGEVSRIRRAAQEAGNEL